MVKINFISTHFSKHFSSSVHKRKVHNIGKPIDDVTPRGPNLKLRKRYQQMQNQEEEFDKLTEDNGTYRPPAKVCQDFNVCAFILKL